MDVNSTKRMLDEKIFRDIEPYIEYREIGIYQGIEGCISYIQQKTGCDRDIAKQIIDDNFEYQPPNETPQQYEAWIAQANNEWKPSNKPKCPYCQSTNLKKISTTSRIISTGLFGLGSSKIGKQWHCNNCKSDF